MQIEVSEQDALASDVEVFVVKYAQARYGVDRMVSEALIRAGTPDDQMRPNAGEYRLVTANGAIGPRAVLFVGTAKLHDLEYPDLVNFARLSLETVVTCAPSAMSVGFTLHGANFGLDEGQAFLSLLAGLDDAAHVVGSARPIRIVFFELEPTRADYLRKFLAQVLPTGRLGQGKGPSPELNPLQTLAARSAQRQHVFVAMPFADEFQDVYDYAIQNAVSQSGLLCERSDLTVFTGDVLSHIKQRISKASLVIGDLSTGNPNVYLEIGYAWGCGVPCVLLARDAADLKFDVRGQRCIIYKRIKDLEKKLFDELASLRAAANSGLQLTWPSRTLGPRS